LTSLLTTLQQFLLFSGAILVTGCVTWRLFIAPETARVVGETGLPGLRAAEDRVARLAFASALVVVLAWFLRGVVQLIAFRDPFVPIGEDVDLLLFQTFWGTVWMVQGGVVVLLAVALLLAHRTASSHRAREEPTTFAPTRSWIGAAPVVLGLSATLAASGHAMGADSGRAIALTADALHALAAGCWIGTLAAVLLGGGPAEAPGGRPADARGQATALLAAQLRRFSPLALVSGTTLVGMGIILSWTHLHAVSDLWATTYGRLLSAKAGLALVVLGLGGVNWRRGLPFVDTPDGAEAVRRRAAGEVTLAGVVVLLTAILVHSTKP
jgi:putative copper export protein